MTHSHRSLQPEFSRILRVDRDVPPLQNFQIEANATERAALAKRFGLVSIEALTAEGTLETLHSGRSAVLSARLRGQVTQSCVVTLERVAASIDERFTLDYEADADTPLPAEVEIDLEEVDPPEPLVDGIVDVGEAVAEHLALALDPYPRAPGVSFEVVGDPNAAEDSPFKALARLVKKGRS